MKTLIRICALLSLGLLALPLQAAIVGGVGTSASGGNLVMGSGGSPTLTWTMTYAPPAGPASSTLSSDTVVFRTLGGQIIGSQSKRISRSVFQGGSYSLTETVPVPASVVYRAHKLGSAGVRVERSFVDALVPGVPSLGRVDLGLSTAPGAGLLISRIDLRFDDDSRLKVLPRDSALVAYADVRLRGNGLLQAVWEIADSASSRGEAQYRPLRVLRQYLGGGDRVTLQSPPLPTGSSGLHLLRLRLIEPETDFDIPVLRYQVQALEAEHSAIQPDPMTLVEPRDGALLEEDTRFAWEPVAGAEAYQLELYEEDSLPGRLAEPSRPMSGALLPARTTELQLSRLTRQHLVPGQEIHWRVVAIDARGRVMAASPLRRFQTP